MERVYLSGRVLHPDGMIRPGTVAIEIENGFITEIAREDRQNLHHTRPGLVGALLADDPTRFGLIADGVHVHPAVLKWLIRAKGAQGITLVTDALAPAGMGKGKFQLGPRRIYVTAEGGTRLANGTLAGSILPLDQAIRNVVDWGAASLSEALHMASTTPADPLGRADLGRIAVGCAADLVVLDASLHLRQTIVGGQVAFADET